MKEIKIFENVPFRKDKDLITAYNDFMELLPEDAYAVFKDADAMYLTPTYGLDIIKAIEDNPEVGCFTCKTNRIGNFRNQIHHVTDSDDIEVHRKIADKMQKKNQGQYTKWNHTTRELLNGMFIVLSKKAWRKMGKVVIWEPGYSKILGVDCAIHRSLLQNNMDVVTIESLYIYHYYSGFNGREGRDVSHLK